MRLVRPSVARMSVLLGLPARARIGDFKATWGAMYTTCMSHTTRAISLYDVAFEYLSSIMLIECPHRDVGGNLWQTFKIYEPCRFAISRGYRRYLAFLISEEKKRDLSKFFGDPVKYFATARFMDNTWRCTSDARIICVSYLTIL